MHGGSSKSCRDLDEEGGERQVYVMCVRSAMVYGSETWAMNVEQSARLEWTEMRIIR